jgi:hypothetical protein
MKGFFKSLFRTSKERQEPIPSRSAESIKEMSIDEILSYAASGELKTSGQAIALIQRLYTIALYDNHVQEQHREIALRLAEALTVDLEKALSENPDGLADLRKANNYMIENARLWGVGSLFWKITEEAVLAAEIPQYVMRPEHRHLVPAYLEALGEETVTKYRKELVRQLILAGQYEAYNAVLILHGLVTKGDEAATALFMGEEYAALLAVPNDYHAGRRVLVGLGLLTETSGARPFKEIAEIQSVVALVLKERSNEAESDNRLAGLSEDQRDALLLALTSLRFHLSYENIRQIYGEETSNSLMDIFTQETTKEGIEQFGKLLRALYDLPPGKPRDLLFLDSVMAFGGIEAKSEDDWNRNRPFLDMGAAWLNRERVEFQCYLRFILRAMSDPVPQIKSVSDEQVVAFLKETYRREGVRAGIAEDAIYGEDWIGING